MSGAIRHMITQPTTNIDPIMLIFAVFSAFL